MKKLLENDLIIISLKYGILFLKWKETVIDLSIAKKMISHRLVVSEKKIYPICSDVRSVKKITKEARDYFASDKGSEGIIASAILIDSPFLTMIGNFFNNINKPKAPSKLFTNEEEAVNWLKNYMEK